MLGGGNFGMTTILFFFGGRSLKKSQCLQNISAFRKCQFGPFGFRRNCESCQVGVVLEGLVSFSSSLRLEAVLWHGALFTEDMSSIYACKHAETIENAVWQTSVFLLIPSQPSFIVRQGPVCLGSTLQNIKKITWAEHGGKWQANTLGISKKTLRVRTYIRRRWSRLQTTTVFTIYCFSMFDFFLFFSSLSLHAIWEVWITKVPEQIACILACIAVFLFTSYLQTRRKDQHQVFLSCVVYISWMGNRERRHIDLQRVQDMHIK